MNRWKETPTRRRLERLAWLLDSSVPIPGLKIRVGLDALIGLIPGVGDAAGALLSSWVLGEAARLGAPKSLLLKMGSNIAIDALVGAVPVLGDIFDIAWRANRRNVDLLERYLDRPGETSASSRRFVLGLCLGLAVFVLLLGFLSFWVVSAVVSLITGG